MNNKQVTDIANLYKSIYEEKEENLNENPLLDRVRSTVVDAGGAVGERVGRNRGGPLGGFFGRRKGKETAGTAFDQATSGKVGDAVKTVQDALRETKDSFDIVKDHLIDEGYADTEEAALAIMTNMSEAWRQSIVEDEQSSADAKERNRRTQDSLDKRQNPSDVVPPAPKLPPAPPEVTKPQNPSPGSAPTPRDQPKDMPRDKQNPSPGSAPAPAPRKNEGPKQNSPRSGQVKGNTDSPGTIGTIERGKPGDGYLGPTIKIPTPFGNTTIGIPNPSPIRRN